MLSGESLCASNAFDARGYIDYPAYEVQEADQACVD
jgi:hypothetical protein